MEQHRQQFHKHEEFEDKCYNMYTLLIKHFISIGIYLHGWNMTIISAIL